MFCIITTKKFSPVRSINKIKLIDVTTTNNAKIIVNFDDLDFRHFRTILHRYKYELFDELSSLLKRIGRLKGKRSIALEILEKHLHRSARRQ